MKLASLPWMDIFLSIAFCSFLFYLWARYRYGYWKRKGVYTPKPSFPWGNVGEVVKGKVNTGVHLGNLYHQNKQHPYCGIFFMFSKTLMVNNLDMIKTIMLKDFQYFTDHGLGISPTNDPLSNHLFNMDGEVWKVLRNKLTPTFTSSKMKYMFNTMLGCSEEMEIYLEKQVAEGNSVDFREVIAKYNTDIIGSCAFGISTNSFKHPDAEFRKMGQKAFELDFVKSIRDIMSLLMPSMIKTFKIRLIHKDIEDFFIKTVSDTVQYREKNNISRNDFLQLLIDMKKKDEQSGNGKSFSIVDITSQVFLFFVAGFETSSTTTSYALYELAKNPRVQEKLRKEIDTVLEKHGGKITYDAVMEMHYLTLVIEESLRMYPPVPFLFRVCTKEYVIPDTDIVIEKGTRVIIPIFGIHRDPEIHEDPNQFNPERFSTENKSKLHPFANLAFGEGPRLCIGNRFGMMQSRLGLINILLKFKVELQDKDRDEKLYFSPKTIILTEEKNRFLRITHRDAK